MPSLRQRVSTYFRQLSFIAEPRESRTQARRSVNDGSFITNYLERGEGLPSSGPEIHSGKDPAAMPDLPIGPYDSSTSTITAAVTGPDERWTIQRSKLHLSAADDIDFIDTIESTDDIRHLASSSSRSLYRGQRSSSGTRANDQNANLKTAEKRFSSRKNSTASIPSNPTPDALNQNVETEEGEAKEDEKEVVSSPIEGVTDWSQSSDEAFGVAVSLYDKNLLTEEQIGSPIADCFGVVARSNCVALALADGVNWGENAKLAARAAIFGCLEYLNTAIFGQNPSGVANNTKEVFISLLRSFWEAHACILEVGGALSTLSCAVVLPLAGDNQGKYVVCACNVGDSLGYVYSQVHGVREFTQGSHDIESMRDMRDALGALGPVDGNKPELGNLTLSMTIVEPGDIVFLTSDGISDNFDPVVGKFAEPLTEELQQKLRREQENVPRKHNFVNEARKTLENAPPVRPARTKKPQAARKFPQEPPPTTKTPAARPKYLRSHTFIEPRSARVPKAPPQPTIPRSAAGLPLVTGAQRHALILLRLTDLFSYGINGTLRPCTTARRLCTLLVDFARMITTARRKLLEQHENFYKLVASGEGVRKEVQMSRNQQRSARKKVIESGTFTALPGKLDHASCCAWKVPSAAPLAQLSVLANSYTETNF